MSPRPRTVEDVEILMATSRAISREGPARFTLADVGREARGARGDLLALREVVLTQSGPAAGGAAAFHSSGERTQ